MRRVVATAALVAAVLTGCGDDGGAPDETDLVRLLEDGGQPEAVAECVADRLADDADVDPDALESIIRGEGSTDLDTANAYGDATVACTAAAQPED